MSTYIEAPDGSVLELGTSVEVLRIAANIARARGVPDDSPVHRAPWYDDGPVPKDELARLGAAAAEALAHFERGSDEWEYLNDIRRFCAAHAGGAKRARGGARA